MAEYDVYVPPPSTLSSSEAAGSAVPEEKAYVTARTSSVAEKAEEGVSQEEIVKITVRNGTRFGSSYRSLSIWVTIAWTHGHIDRGTSHQQGAVGACMQGGQHLSAFVASMYEWPVYVTCDDSNISSAGRLKLNQIISSTIPITEETTNRLLLHPRREELLLVDM